VGPSSPPAPLPMKVERNAPVVASKALTSLGKYEAT
jgi:hypothetical protein